MQRRDPRLTALHDRVGRLRRDGEQVGLLLVRVQPFARRTGGHLWWGRWAVGESLLTWSTVDGRREEHTTHQDRLEGELRDLDRGLFRYRGEVLRVEWAEGEEAERLRASFA